MAILSQEQVSLLTDYDADSTYSTAYHTLYANIRFSWNDEQLGPHTILFATPAAYPGYAGAAANVAIAAAQSNTPTILIDASLHTPGLQQRFGVVTSGGLSNLLAEEKLNAQTLALCLSETFVPNLRLLCAGTATVPSQEISRLLATRLPVVLAGLRQYLAESSSEQSLIIFNSAPVLASINTAQISSIVDQTFLLISSGRTSRTQAKRAQEQLERAHAKLTGIVMLDV
ncbi:hypothetical protein EPA93_21610 [Ktedonosporobacter rubrisoli]|uniref:CpsD/CapB family tyrosine-protein kinase n=1 Tax=Ktedonosporobacter rubrisoli TaxID=2509675 RepID=A0A4P6JT41_KTERU|nr:hypothetical protein [Ktedonosporobacter rubrisoli]QBD78450.1 hypothetical protein EPA93_21610 [Ktedonosporobacter rubrisoli]